MQFARRPSFVSGKRGVTFFRAMFVDRSGVQIAVQHAPPSPPLSHTHTYTLEIEASSATREGKQTSEGRGTNKPFLHTNFMKTKNARPSRSVARSKSGRNEDRFPQAAATSLYACSIRNLINKFHIGSK